MGILINITIMIFSSIEFAKRSERGGTQADRFRLGPRPILIKGCSKIILRINMAGIQQKKGLREISSIDGTKFPVRFNGNFPAMGAKLGSRFTSQGRIFHFPVFGVIPNFLVWGGMA